MPCADPLNCPSVESPTANLTAELADANVSFGYHFERHYSQLCESLDPAVAALCDPARPLNPQAPQVFSNSAQSCTEICNDLTTRTYTVSAGAFLGMTQAEANAFARQLACRGATALCQGGEVFLYTNTAQSCAYACPSGSRTYTTPAGAFSDFSQAEADAAAHAFACALAALLCGGPPGGDGPPLPPSGLPGSGSGSGDPPPPDLVYYNNAPQIATAVCGDQTFTFTTAAGLFQNTSLLAANASALSYAQNQVALLVKCLSNLGQDHVCAGIPFSATITQTGVGVAAQLNWGAAGMPAGMTFTDGVFSGTPAVGGDYTITVGVENAFTGASVSRNYTLHVQQIITVNLPPATEGSLYGQALDAIGTVGSLTWAIVGGALPPGLGLHTTTGVISGTPILGDEIVAPVTYDFTVGVTSAGLQCSKAFSIVVEPDMSLVPENWWKLGEAVGDREDSINGALLSVQGGSPTNAAGIVGNALKLISDSIFFGQAIGSGANDPKLKYNGNGWDCFVWFRIDVDALTSDSSGHFFLTENYIVWFSDLWAGNNNMAFIFRGDSTGQETVNVPFNFVIGDWVLIRVYYDNVTQKFGVQINNGAKVETVGTHVWSATDFGWLGLAARASTTLYEVRFDECGIFQKKLSDAEASQVWNGGAGRTFP